MTRRLPTIHGITEHDAGPYRMERLDLEFSNGERRQFERLHGRGHGAVAVVPMLDAATVLLVRALGELVKATGLTGTDRTLGFCFGLARGLVIVMAALIFLPALMPVAESDWWAESSLIPGFLQFESWARDILSAIFEWIASIFN